MIPSDSSSALSLGWSSPNLPTAIGIMIGAGLATAVGGVLAFLPDMWRALPQRTILGISLALSAGVMLYVSFTEILPKSHMEILAAGMSEAAATGLTALCFFLGMGLTVLLELLVHVIFERRKAGRADAPSDLPTVICACHMDLEADEGDLPMLVHDNKEAVPPHHAHQHAHHHSHMQCTTISMECAPAAAAGERTHPTPPSSNAAAAPTFVPSSSMQPGELQRIDEAPVTVEILSAPAHDLSVSVSGSNCEAASSAAKDSDHVVLNSPNEKRRLARMGILTALAISIHNFPEGLATFIATLADAHVCSASTDPASALPSPDLLIRLQIEEATWLGMCDSCLCYPLTRPKRWAVEIADGLCFANANCRSLPTPLLFTKGPNPPFHQAAQFAEKAVGRALLRRSAPPSAWPLPFTTSPWDCALRCPSTTPPSLSGRHLPGLCSWGRQGPSAGSSVTPFCKCAAAPRALTHLPVPCRNACSAASSLAILSALLHRDGLRDRLLHGRRNAGLHRVP